MNHDSQSSEPRPESFAKRQPWLWRLALIVVITASVVVLYYVTRFLKTMTRLFEEFGIP